MCLIDPQDADVVECRDGSRTTASREIAHIDKLSLARKIPLFNDFSDNELQEVLQVGDWEEHGPGDTVIQEGLDDYSICVLITGDVVVKKRGQDLTTLKAGDCCGEMGYLARGRRTATI